MVMRKRSVEKSAALGPVKLELEIESGTSPVLVI
jgi:hypothetical protein